MAVAHIGIDARRIGPIGFDGDDGKAVLLDQALRDGGTGAVEFRSAVRGLAQEHDFGVGKAVEQGAEGLFIGGRRQKQLLVRFDPRPDPLAGQLIAEFVVYLSNREHTAIRDSFIEPLPKRRKALCVVIAENADRA